jgi:hypothetical protein
MNSWACPTKLNFVVAAQPQGQASVRVGWFGFLSQWSTAGLATPTPRVASGAEVLALHLRDASVMANPLKTALTQQCGAPRRCTSRAARRALPPSKGAAPDLQRWQGRFDKRQMHARHDTLCVELDGRTCQLPCGACPRECTAHSTLSTHDSCPSMVRPWLAALR